MSDLAKVRIQIGENSLFTRMEIDGVELKGITRLWFDSGDLNGQDGPRYTWRGHTRIHVEFYPQDLSVEGEAEVSKVETRPVP